MRRLAAIGAVAAVVAAIVVVTVAPWSSASCAAPERSLDPSVVHVLPGTEPVYEWSPPVSGPHQLPAPTGGLRDQPIAEAAQVGALESGSVIIQYMAGSIEPDALAGLAGDDVIVMPAARELDDGAEVAFSAWGVRRLCDRADADAAQRFIDRYVGVASADHDD